MVDIQTVSIVVASASVVAAGIYYVFHLRNQTRTRHTELVMRLFSIFGSKEFQVPWQKILNSESKE